MRAVMVGSPHLQQFKTKKKKKKVNPCVSYSLLFAFAFAFVYCLPNIQKRWRFSLPLPLPLFIVYQTFKRDGDEDKVGDTSAYCFIYLAVRSAPHV
jgi:hypothetical protein